jgi:hypothetical protein
LFIKDQTAKRRGALALRSYAAMLSVVSSVRSAIESLPSIRSFNRAAKLTLLGLALVLTLCGAWNVASAQAKAATTTTLAVTSGGGAVTTVASGSVVTLTATVQEGTAAVTPGQVNFCDTTAKFCTDVHLLGTAQLTKRGNGSAQVPPRDWQPQLQGRLPGNQQLRGKFLGGIGAYGDRNLCDHDCDYAEWLCWQLLTDRNGDRHGEQPGAGRADRESLLPG